MIEMGGVWESRIQSLGGERTEGKRPLGSPRRKWEHNIEINL